MSDTRVPIREQLFVEGVPPMLLGSRDRHTGQIFFPAETMNPVTLQDSTLEPHAFDGAGTLVSWTVIGRGMPGFDSPYAIATVQLNAGPAFIGQLHDWQGKALRPGMPVVLTIERIKTDKDGRDVVGPKFIPLE